MRMRGCEFSAVTAAMVALLIGPRLTTAQSSAGVQRLGEALAVSTQTFGSTSTVVELSGRRLLVNESGRQRVLLLDSSLAAVSIAIDSGADISFAYGPRGGSLLSTGNDAALLVSPGSTTLRMIDSQGKIDRSVPAPVIDFPAVTAAFGRTAADSLGRLFYQGVPRPVQGSRGPVFGQFAAGFPNLPDSAPVIRFDPRTGRADTMTFVHVNLPRVQMIELPTGARGPTLILDPLPIVDDWGVQLDGGIVVVRGANFHVQWITADKRLDRTTSIQFNWEELSPSAKIALIDSMQQLALERNTSAAGTIARRFIAAESLSNRKPAFAAGAARVDLDGNLWVRTSTPLGGVGGVMYYVVERNGSAIGRVSIEPGLTIVGFGRARTVYVLRRGPLGSTLERRRVPPFKVK